MSTALANGIPSPLPTRLSRHEIRARADHAALCMEEAAVGVWTVTGLGLCISVMAWDVGLGHLVSFDGERAVVWSVLAAGMHRKRTWPAVVLLFDLVARTAWQLGIGDTPFLPAVAVVGALVVRGILAQVDLAEEPALAR